MRVIVIGGGYVGLVTAVGLATFDHDVLLVESQAARLEAIRRGTSPIHEVGLQESLRLVIDRGLLRAAAGIPPDTAADVVFVCVGTPIDERGRADLSQLDAALSEVAGLADRGASIVVRSTMPVGTTRRAFQASGVPADRLFVNPEFLRQGTALQDFLNPTRIIIGRSETADPQALARPVAIFESFAAPLRIVTLEEAELIKNGANAFLALKLSFANEVTALAEHYSADIDTVIDGISLDPRIGPQHLRPSYGFGGSCLPKELQTLALAGLSQGLEMHVTFAAAEANAYHQRRFAERIDRALGTAQGKTITLLGLAFKAGTDDVRSSPALSVARWLISRGAVVRGHDPAAGANAAAAVPSLLVLDDPVAALRGADACAITTEWSEYRDLDWHAIHTSMAQPVVLDGRRLLDRERMVRLGFRYERIGGPPIESGVGDPRHREGS